MYLLPTRPLKILVNKHDEIFDKLMHTEHVSYQKPQKPVFMSSGEEIGPFLTHYFFRPLYLSTAIIRPFDRALLLISGDIEENPGPVSFDRYKKKLPPLFPLPPQHLHRPTIP